MFYFEFLIEWPILLPSQSAMISWDVSCLDYWEPAVLTVPFEIEFLVKFLALKTDINKNNGAIISFLPPTSSWLDPFSWHNFKLITFFMILQQRQHFQNPFWFLKNAEKFKEQEFFPFNQKIHFYCFFCRKSFIYVQQSKVFLINN